MTELSALRVEKMPHGGFVVTDGRGDAGFITAALFASTSIGEALAFVCGRLDPEAFKTWQEVQARDAAAKEQISRAFATPREHSRGCRCVRCEQARCNTCGRGVRVSEFTKPRRSDAGDWAGA